MLHEKIEQAMNQSNESMQRDSVGLNKIVIYDY